MSEDTPVADDFLLQVADSARFDPDGPTHETFAPFPGEQIGRYLLIDKLAQGNFGFVFSARDVELDRVVALKVLNPDHANKREIVRRFLQEASATARVVHPGVVTILDCGRYNGGAYIAMDLLDGESLTARLENCGRFLPHDAVEVARQIAAALEAAHEAGVLHRDLKPDNIFVVNDPSMPDGLRIKILDFGLAKVIEETGTSSRIGGQTRVHSVFGTPRYMSPEQCRSSTTIDHRADIYSLGCILFELVTGAAPFAGDIGEVVEAHLVGSIPRASMFVGCTAHLDQLIMQLMAKDPDRRPQSMTAVRRALDKLPLGRLGSTPLTPPPHVSPLPVMPNPATVRPGATSMITTPKLPAVPARPIPSIRSIPALAAHAPSSPKPQLPPMAIPRVTSRPHAQPPQPAAPASRIVAPGSARVSQIVQGMLSVPTAPGVTSLSTGEPARQPAQRLSPAAEPTSFAPHQRVSSDSGPRVARGTEHPPQQPARQPLPPFFPKPPMVAASPHAPMPDGGTPFAQPTAFPQQPPHHHIGWPRAAACVELLHRSSPAFAPSGNAGGHAVLAPATMNPTVPALHVPIAVPVHLPAPSRSTQFGVADHEPPPASKVPLIVLAIACVLSGTLAALVSL